MNLPRTPGFLTDEDLSPKTLAKLRAHGFKWVAPQVQNATQAKRRDLDRIKAEGLVAPVWGVTYSPDRFFEDARLLAELAVELGAHELIMDVEQAAKNTRDSRGLKPIIDGARAGGWKGAVHLNTMGPPHGANDYAIDVASFLDTGGGVFTQAHFNETPSFRPKLAVAYWTRVGVPLNRLNLQVSVYPSESDKETPNLRLSGAHLGQLLLEAGQGMAFSVFRAEGCTDDDLAALGPLTVVPAPLPAPSPPPQQPPKPTPVPPVGKAPKLKRALRGGEEDTDVKMLQRALNKWAGVPALALKVTSVYDQPTQDRVGTFQAERGIRPVTKDVGQGTLNELWPFFDLYGRTRYRAFRVPKPKPEPPPLIEPRQGFDSLHASLWEAYSEGRRRGFTDLGTFVAKPGDHGIGPPCFAFDLGHETRFFNLGWGWLKARSLAQWYVKNHLRLNIEYVIIGRRIWSRTNGWHAYTRDTSHDWHIHVSGHHS